LLDSGGPETLPAWLLFVPPSLLAIQYLSRRFQWAEKLRNSPDQLFLACCGSALAIAVSLLPLSNRPFIYFQF
jgi:hypothetical protein